MAGSGGIHWLTQSAMFLNCFIACKSDKDNKGKNEDGEETSKLALDEFFQKYVDKWFQQGKVDSGLYYRCRTEIDELKGKVKKSKTKKTKKISKEDLYDVSTVKQLPADLDKNKKKMGADNRPEMPINKKSKEGSSPASVSQEQYVMMTQTYKEQHTMAQKYQEACDKIQELEDEMAKLTMDKESISRTVERLNGELKRSYAQINDIQIRYSKLASETLKNNNPNIADLSDPNRPTEITKHFSELYDNEWSDAYEILTTKLKSSEEESLQILFDIVVRSFEFMEEQREEQVQQIRQALLYPVYFALTKVFRDIEIGRLLAPHEQITNTMPEALKKYAYRCAQLCWHMVIADPPIYMTKSVAEKPFNLDVYRPYTKSIKGLEKVVVEADVWPALYLHFEGPLLNKGVAQPGNARRK